MEAMSENLATRRAIAEDMLGHALDANGYAPCPWRHLHTGKGNARDFRVVLEGAPTAFCFHSSCAGEVEIFNAELRSRIGKAECNPGARRPHVLGNVAAPPVGVRKPKRPPYEPAKLADFARRCPFPIDAAWLAKRSPVPIPEAQGTELATLFLSALYKAGERVLIFTSEFSQGDFLFDVSRGSFRLGDSPGIQAVPSPLPDGGKAGVWFLAQPVKGTWLANLANRATDGSPKMGRRHGDCVTSWRFLVLESDEAPPELWLRALVQLPLPLVAIYTSGGRSIHALARVDCESKAQFDSLRDDLIPVLCPLGADAAAITAVRLTRLPGTLRHGTKGKDGKLQPYPAPRLQRLLYLNPNATARAILDPPA